VSSKAAGGYNFATGKMETESKLDLPDQMAEWKLEPELACPIPREVVLKKGFIRKLVQLHLSISSLGSSLQQRSG